MSTPEIRPARQRSWERQTIVVSAAALGGAAAIGGVVARAPLPALAGTAAIALGALVILRPAVAGYLMIGLTPLIVGIDRDRVIPVLRPNEALLLLCAVALSLRGVWEFRTGAPLRPRLGLIAASIVLMAISNSVTPLLAMSLRGNAVSTDDILYAAVLWKYLALYAVIRASIRTEHQVRRCIGLSMFAASIVALVAILQALQLFGVAEILATYYAPFGDSERLANSRGSSTLALSAAVGDLLIMNLALCAGQWRRRALPVAVLGPLAVLFVLGTFASGQFSGVIGLLVAAIALGVVARSAAMPFAVGVTGIGAVLLLQPVVANRLSGFNSVSGLPQSWTGRLYNLSNYFWPRLFSDYNYVWGVEPSARVPAPAVLRAPWVWIESGYTWLLWGGGIPLAISYLVLVAASVRRSWAAVNRPDSVGSVATGVFVAVLVITVLMLFDPHITYRGTADLLFALLPIIALPPRDSVVVGRLDLTRRVTER
jgi:hypothetical protein